MTQTQQTQTLTGLSFRVQLPDGGPQQLLVDSDRVLIGSGAHCEIRLPGDTAASEHVLITFLGGNVYAQARSLQPPPLLNGAPFTEAPLAPNSLLQIGLSEITVSIVEIADQAGVKKKQSEPISPLTYILAILLVPLALFVLLDDPKDDVMDARPESVPALWDEAAPACPAQAKDQALGAAVNRRLIAQGKRERSPFDVRDGVQAVPLFQQAAACYRAAGDSATAAEMQAAAEKIKKQLEEDYRAHQMRLMHSLDVKDLRTAHREVKVMLAMLQGKNDPYVVWLSNMDRRLKLRLGATNKR
ncbi:MAG TPA: FHA domain-containing protein [Candidatus Nanopelagicales bacterium]|nr:FHA domain-containing protein [Candidatus Nanopelagicales bacterium]